MLEAALQRRLGGFTLGVELVARPGEVTVLLGESGSGKTTILNLLAGVLYPERGYIRLDGKTYFDGSRRVVVPAHRRPVGYIYQDYVLFPHLNVFENVAFGLRAQRMTARVVREKAQAILQRLGIADLASRKPGQLSGGQQQRVALARALVLEPKLLLLDEPLAALDRRTRQEIEGELQKLLQGLSCVTLWVTHDLTEAVRFGERIVVVEEGRVVQAGRWPEIRDRPRTPYVAVLAGVNLFEGTALPGQGGGAVQVRTGPGSVSLWVAEAPPGPVLVAVDPRRIALYRVPPDPPPANLLAGPVIRLGSEVPAGDRLRVWVGTRPPLVAEMARGEAEALALRAGEPVLAGFEAGAAVAYR